MNLLVVTQYYFPEQFRVNDICEDLAAKGHHVEVLTGLPNYPDGEIYDGYKNKAGSIEEINGVEVHRSRLFPRKKGGKNLLLNYVSFVVYGCREAKRMKKNYDAVFVYQMSPVTMALPAIRVCKRGNIPLILYCLDLWPASILDHGIKRNGGIYRIVELISTYIYKKCNTIIVSSPSFKGYIANMIGVDKESIKYLPQHAEDLYIVSDDKNEDGICHFMFLGNIGYSQNCECIVEAAKKIRPGINFKIHFVGAGSKMEEVKSLVKAYGLEDKLIFHGFQKLDQIQKYYEMADVCILTLINDSEIGLTIPAKLQGYMAAGKPVVAAISGDAKVVIEEAHCGYCVEAGDSENLARSMEKMIGDREGIREMGENARKYFDEHFSRKVVLDKLEQTILQALAEVS